MLDVDYSKMKLETVEACAFLDDDRVREQIRLRHYMVEHVLVGWLYRSITADEISKLHLLLEKRTSTTVVL